MKKNKILILSLLATWVIAIISCSPDNYDKPTSPFSGRVVYKDQPLGIRGSSSDVYLLFFQDGYELKSSFACIVSQDGSYSAMLFDGTYKLVMNALRGPWVNNPDTVVVVVKGKTVKDYPVTPYYTLSNISYNLSGTRLRASFDVTLVDGSRAIEYVALMVNKTQFVDIGSNTHVAWTQVTGANAVPGHFDMELDISNVSNYPFLYARVGVKIAGIDHAIYDTKVEKIK